MCKGKLMLALDALNQRYGSSTVKVSIRWTYKIGKFVRSASHLTTQRIGVTYQ
jgi:hypothetical protein